MKTPRYDYSNVPVCTPGMGITLARLNGYKHGFEGVVTEGICTLVKGTEEYKAWHEGYVQGEHDRGMPYEIP